MASPIERLRGRTARPATESRVIDLAGEESEDVLDALATGTRRQLYLSLFDSTATTSELAERVDTSVQNVHHHVSVLRDVGLVEPIDTVYSEKGNEMTVYGPASDPLVLVGDHRHVGSDDVSLADLGAGVGLLALASVVVQWAAERVWTQVSTVPGAVGTASYADGGSSLVATIAWFVFEVVEPGVLFFVAGLLVAVLVSLASGGDRTR
ncbi:ArsR/SmtB family transcription factor [Halobaculum roseum]|uniref:ArsR/SmtB family transcription factor n=1 Tax=Halobaculum roseum TaxID=2175149 RepID=A0ABD5MU20_9EURY|nr:winged helix-turn-helix domain-containing protein [Halobaculum roseum]QZY01819.1 winged helix-turn-helix domain-containing protein [Halobaculum roseum]